MTDRPILFSGPMVLAILDGRKTQTRRVLGPQPDPHLPIAGAQFVTFGDEPGRWCWLNGFDGSIVSTFSPRFAIGDRLWVREAWRVEQCFDDRSPSSLPNGEIVARQYEADGARSFWKYDHLPAGRLRPSLHMPRWASRLTLTVTDVRVERVQDISEADAIAEGFGGHPDPIGALALLWDSLNAARGYGWDANPWVVARTFTAERRNIDAEKTA